VSIIGCTGDWFGGWDGLTPGSVDQFITADLKRGRLPEVIARGEPAVLVCHWPGIYFNGQEIGFKIFQEVVRRLNEAYDNLLWMKLSEISRYWAARELTLIERPDANGLVFRAPFACPQFTVKLELPSGAGTSSRRVRLRIGQNQTALAPVDSLHLLKSGTVHRGNGSLVACLDLPKGSSRLELAQD
jgi:hypothetical protein